MVKKLNLDNYYKRWIVNISKNENCRTVKRHVVKHAKEVYSKEPKEWSASMWNLLEIFDKFYKIKPSLQLKIKRLHNKYKKNPKRYTGPPAV